MPKPIACNGLRIGVLLLVPAFLACAGSADRLVDRAGQAIEREAGERIDRGADAAADAAEGTVTADGEEEGGAAAGAAPGGDPATDIPRAGEGADTNYDFVRGDRPIFMEDYSRDNVGDFPRNLTLIDGNWDVVEWEGRRYLRGTGGRGSAFEVRLAETLPERFTVEFEVMYTHGNQRIIMLTSPLEQGGWNRHDAALVHVRSIETGIRIPSENREIGARIVDHATDVLDRPTPVRLMVDGDHVKVYAAGRRVANVPNAVVRRSDRLRFQDVYMSRPDNPIFIGSIRVDAGGRDLYDELAREGSVTLRGILFDTNSDRIRPESRSALEEIGRMLREHPDLRLSIEGHTDSEGAEEHNRDLSQRRANSVRRWLLEEFGVDGDRLRAVGMGESAPVASNDSEAGRQENRRVELVRIP